MHTLDADQVGRDGFLVAESVAAGYGAAMVIWDATVTVSRGEVVAIIGPNGAGKSTLLKAITGAITVSEGSVRLAGETISGRRPDEIARLGVGYVPQLRDIFPRLTVTENLEMGGYALRRNEVAERMEEVLAMFPALARITGRSAAVLSGGERKMLAIARALMTRPSVVLLDEPTANLAPKLATEFLRDHVGKLAESGVAVLIVEQRAIEALNVSSRAYLMAAGTVEHAASARYFLEHDAIGELFLGRRHEHGEFRGSGDARSQPGGGR
jgi:branched-chain amino acid transport system ATP-binding protein